MNYKFKKFVATNQRSEDRITVTGNNSFGFPTKFYKDNNIKDYKYVILFYDREEKAVGFKFTNDEEEKHKFSINKSKVGYGGSIIANSFFKSQSLKSSTYKGRYVWEKIEDPVNGTLFVVLLKERI